MAGALTHILKQRVLDFLQQYNSDQLDSIRYSGNDPDSASFQDEPPSQQDLMAPTPLKVFDVIVDVLQLLNFEPRLVAMVKSEVNVLHRLVLQAIRSLPDLQAQSIDIRFRYVPATFIRDQIRDITWDMRGKFVVFQGLVVGCIPIQAIADQKTFACTQCLEQINVGADRTKYNEIETPTSCPDQCRNAGFTEVADKTVWKDYMEIRLSEMASGHGVIPQRIAVLLEGNLAGTCEPGETIEVTGSVLARWKPMMVGKEIDVQIAIIASTVRPITKLSNDPVEDPIEIPEDDFMRRFTLIQSTAKHLTGLHNVKLGLLLTLLGGVDSQERKTRNLFHMLMIGEECTGKSELLKEAAALTEKSKILNSVGVSKAGLSMGAVKEGKEWVIEAGALVLTDQGLCCIDDIDKLSKD